MIKLIKPKSRRFDFGFLIYMFLLLFCFAGAFDLVSLDSKKNEVENGVWALFSGDINQDENLDLYRLYKISSPNICTTILLYRH